MRYLLVGNPTAQTGKGKAAIERALRRMKARGWGVDFLPTEPEGRTVQVVAEAIDSGLPDVVIYLGGDGTFAEVAKGILAAKRLPPLGMLPSGTANDQGKSFGIRTGSAALDDNLDVIDAGYRLEVDAGRIQQLDDDGQVLAEDTFFDSAGWGMQSDILAIRNLDRDVVKDIPLIGDILRDQLLYASAAVQEYLASYLEPTKFAAEVIADGERRTFEGLTDLVINATPIYAGEWVLDRLSDPDDGLLECVPFCGRRELFSKAIRDFKDFPIWQEHLDALGVTHSKGFSAAKLEIRLLRSGREEIQSQIDGEEWVPGHRFRIEVIAGCLPVIAPEEWVAPWKLG